MNEAGKSNEDILKELITAFSSLKQKMEDPNYIALENSIKNMENNQRDMKDDISELKRALLNPFDGVIVNTNKNTEFREDYESWREEREKLIDEHKALMKWKGTYIKVFWTLFTTALGILAFFIGEKIIN